MADVTKARIRKKTYNFELKHKFDYEQHFQIKERPPIEKIKDAIKSILNPPKKEKKAEAPEAGAPPPAGGFNFMVFGAAVLVAVIILALGWLFLTTQVLTGGPAGFESQLDKPIIRNTLVSGEILSSGERGSPEYSAAVLVDYKTDNLENYTIALTPYNERIPSDVFILNSEKIEATTYPDFIRVLRANLSKRQIVLNEITIKELETLPQGAIVLIPSGAIPKEILGFDSLLTMDKLAERGIVIIYVGQPFTRLINGSLVMSTPSAELTALPITFDQSTQLSSKDNFTLFQPLYRAVGRGGNWESEMIYGSVSAVKKGDGAFIFLPQTLDGGWRMNYESAAKDIARIIIETPWAEPSGITKEYVITNSTLLNDSRYFFTDTFEKPNATVRVEFTGYSPASKTPAKEALFISLEKDNNNELFIENGVKVVSTNITQELARLNAILKEPQAAQPEMFLIIEDIYGQQEATFPQGPVNVQADRSFDIPVYVDKGEYIVSLIDDESHEYAQSYMKVVSIDIDHTGYGAKPSMYKFEVTMDGQPVTLNSVSVVVDGGAYGAYTFSNVDTIIVDVGARTDGQLLPLGNHSFEFTSGALTLDVPVVHERQATIFSDPLFWLVLILTGGVVAIGVLFARQEEIYYSIDIPPFPPITRSRVPLSPDTVLSLFAKVNENYRWESTPLTPTEIKNGFKSIFYQGKPIIITDYNVEYLLEELEKRGSVKGSLGYYGLSDWEEKTNRSMDYLVLLRRLRDICVNNAVPFTGMGESKDADSVITVVGQQMYLHFFDKQGDVESMFRQVLNSINKGITIILFKNEHEKQQFVSLLNSSPSVAPLILKMEADSKSLLFNTSDELEDMIKEFKSV
jgi:hypothetical protein